MDSHTVYTCMLQEAHVKFSCCFSEPHKPTQVEMSQQGVGAAAWQLTLWIPAPLLDLPLRFLRGIPGFQEPPCSFINADCSVRPAQSRRPASHCLTYRVTLKQSKTRMIHKDSDVAASQETRAPGLVALPSTFNRNPENS